MLLFKLVKTDRLGRHDCSRLGLGSGFRLRSGLRNNLLRLRWNWFSLNNRLDLRFRGRGRRVPKRGSNYWFNYRRGRWSIRR